MKFSLPGAQVLVSVGVRAAPPTSNFWDGGAPVLEGMLSGFTNSPMLIVPAGVPSTPSAGSSALARAAGSPHPGGGGAQDGQVASPSPQLSGAASFPSMSELQSHAAAAEDASLTQALERGGRPRALAVDTSGARASMSVVAATPGAGRKTVGRRVSVAAGAPQLLGDHGATAAETVVWVDFVIRVRKKQAALACVLAACSRAERRLLYSLTNQTLPLASNRKTGLWRRGASRDAEPPFQALLADQNPRWREAPGHRAGPRHHCDACEAHGRVSVGRVRGGPRVVLPHLAAVPAGAGVAPGGARAAAAAGDAAAGARHGGDARRSGARGALNTSQSEDLSPHTRTYRSHFPHAHPTPRLSQAALQQMLACFGVSSATVAPPEAARGLVPAPATLFPGTAATFDPRRSSGGSIAFHEPFFGHGAAAAASPPVTFPGGMTASPSMGSLPVWPPPLILPPTPLAKAEDFQASLAAALGGQLRPCVLVIESPLMLGLMAQGFAMPHPTVRMVVLGGHADLKAIFAAAPAYPTTLAAMRPVKAASLWRRVQAAALCAWPPELPDSSSAAATRLPSASMTGLDAAAFATPPGGGSAAAGGAAPGAAPHPRALVRPSASSSQRQMATVPEPSPAVSPAGDGHISVLLVEDNVVRLAAAQSACAALTAAPPQSSAVVHPERQRGRNTLSCQLGFRGRTQLKYLAECSTPGCYLRVHR